MKKKYLILKYVNRNHSFFSRISLAGASYAFVLLITKSHSLAKTSFNDFCKNDFKMGFRRFLKFLEIYLGIQIVTDITINFCDDITERGLLDLDKKFKNLIRESKTIAFKANYLYVIAALIEIDQKKKSLLIDQFNKNAQDLINLGNKKIKNKRFKIKGSKYKNSYKGDFNKLNAKSALEEWDILFPKNKFKWFVISGTFLGLVREGDFLKHDYDIDIGIHYEDLLLDEIIAKINNTNFFLIRKIEYVFQGYFKKDKYIKSIPRRLVLIKVIHRTGLNIDLFIHYREKGICWHGSTYHRWNNHQFELKKYFLKGLEVLGPKDADLYLTENYGSWRIPVTNFNFSTGTPNLSVSISPSSIAMLIKRMSIFASEEGFLQIKLTLKKFNILTEEEIFNLRNISYSKR